mgnify:CR=1 FL=1
MAESTYIQELKRKENDLIRVYNPTDKDHVVEYDRKNGAKLFRVPGLTEEVLPRYIARKYVEEMFGKIVNEKAAAAIIRENERRISVGMAEMTPWKEQVAFESKFYNLNEDDTKKLISILYVGLEREFGIDRLTVPDTRARDDKSDFERTLDDVITEKDQTPANTAIDENLTPPSPTTVTFSCDFPGCNFKTATKIALFGHKRSHRDESAKLEAVKSISK